MADMTGVSSELMETPPVRHAPRAVHAARRLGLAIALAATLATAAGPAVLAADPVRPASPPTVTGVTTTAERTRTVDLFRSGAAVEQYTSYWCVPAAVQTMINLATGRSDRTYATQSRLYTELRKANLYQYSTRGNDVRGWARVLTARLPVGMGYADQSYTSRPTAYLEIVKAMDATRRPVGIVVDEGTHAWTVVGFSITETPGVPNSTTVLGFYVVGPLGSPSDPWPKRYYTVSQLNARFTRYHEWQRSVPWEGKYVIVAPLSNVGSVSITR
jgi:hypothetical protein